MAMAMVALAAAAAAQPPPGAGGARPPPWELGFSAQVDGPASARSGDGRATVLDTGITLARRQPLERGVLRLGGSFHRIFLETAGVGDSGTWTGIAEDYDRLAISAFYLRPGRWTWTALAAVESSHRVGVSPEEGLSGVALVAAQTRVNRALTLGAGLLAGLRLDDDPLVIPIPVVEYRWGRDWSLALERGITLRHRPGGGPDVYFAEASIESHRYRLPYDEPAAPGGVLAHRRITARLGWDGRWGRHITARLFAGAAAWQEFVLKDDDRNTVRRLRTDPALSAGLEVRYAF